MKKFSVEEAFRFGWRGVKENSAVFIVLLIFLILVQIGPQIFSDMSAPPLFRFFLGLTFWLLQMYVTLEILGVTLRIADGRKSEFAGLLASQSFLLRYILSSILHGVVIVCGLILFVVPGIIFAVRFMYAPYLILDENLSVFDAFKKSYRITEGQTFSLLWLGIIFGIFNGVGALFFGIGLLLTMPVTLCAHAYVYRILNGSVPVKTEVPSVKIEPVAEKSEEEKVISESKISHGILDSQTE